MNNKITGVLAITSLVLASLACQAVLGGGNDSTPAAPSSNIIFNDDFSSTQWGVGSDENSSVEYADNALQMMVFTTNYFIWSTPNDQNYQDIHMEVTVINNDTDSTTAFGIMCNQQANDNNFYYLAITPAGEYAIAKTTNGENDLFLTNNDQWAYSSRIAANASSYRIGSDCSRGILVLYVDDQLIASATDSSYLNGGVGLFTWSGEEVDSANVSFDDFLVTELP